MSQNYNKKLYEDWQRNNIPVSAYRSDGTHVSTGFLSIMERMTLGRTLLDNYTPDPVKLNYFTPGYNKSTQEETGLMLIHIRAPEYKKRHPKGNWERIELQKRLLQFPWVKAVFRKLYHITPIDNFTYTDDLSIICKCRIGLRNESFEAVKNILLDAGIDAYGNPDPQSPALVHAFKHPYDVYPYYKIQII
jgi:hypothetical protein